MAHTEAMEGDNSTLEIVTLRSLLECVPKNPETTDPAESSFRHQREIGLIAESGIEYWIQAVGA
jgi:hypothetical protein